MVRPHVWERTAGEVPGLDALVEATEMVDNTRRVVALREFMEDAAKLLDGGGAGPRGRGARGARGASSGGLRG